MPSPERRSLAQRIDKLRWDLHYATETKSGTYAFACIYLLVIVGFMAFFAYLVSKTAGFHETDPRQEIQHVVVHEDSVRFHTANGSFLIPRIRETK